MPGDDMAEFCEKFETRAEWARPICIHCGRHRSDHAETDAVRLPSLPVCGSCSHRSNSLCDHPDAPGETFGGAGGIVRYSKRIYPKAPAPPTWCPLRSQPSPAAPVRMWTRGLRSAIKALRFAWDDSDAGQVDGSLIEALESAQRADDLHMANVVRDAVIERICQGNDDVIVGGAREIDLAALLDGEGVDKP